MLPTSAIRTNRTINAPISQGHLKAPLNNQMGGQFKLPPLVDIPFSPGLELFQIAVKEGYLLPNGEAAEKLATAPLTPLTRSALESLKETLDHFDITAALLHIAPDLKAIKAHNFDANKCIKIVGSAMFWILGREYMRALLKEADIDLDLLPKEFLDRIFKKPADLDIRLDLRGVHLAVLETIGKKMTAFMRNSKSCPIIIEEEPFLYAGENICYNIIGIKRSVTDIRRPISNINRPNTNIKKPENDNFSADIVIAGKLMQESLSAMTGSYLCLSLNDLELIRDNKLQQLYLCPLGEYVSAAYNLFICLMGRFVSKDYKEINISGSRKYIMTIADGKMALHQQLHEKLWDEVHSKLKEPGRDAMDKLHKLIKSHSPSCLAYPVAVLFNIRTIFLDLFKQRTMGSPLQGNDNCYQKGVFEPKEWVEFNKSLFPSQMPIAQGATLKKPIQALHNLMQGNDLPHEVISAFLLLQSNLFMARKQRTDRKSISVCTDRLAEKYVTLMTLYDGKEDATLLLNGGIPSALNTLLNYFKCGTDTSKFRLLKQLEEFFFTGIETTFPIVSYVDAPNEELQGRLMIASAAGELLKYKELKAVGFMLLCQASQRMGLKANLPFLSANLLLVLMETEVPQQRVAILQHYLHYLERCHPQDGLFQVRDKIDDLLALFGSQTSSVNTKEKCIQAFCKTFTYSHHSFLATSIFEEVQKEDKKIFLQTAQEMIKKYLDLRPPAASLALNILSTITKNQQIPYKDLLGYFQKIFFKYEPFRLLFDLDRLQRTAIALLERKEKNDTDLENQVYFLLIDLSLKHFDNGAALLDKAEKNDLFVKCPELLSYLHFCCCRNEMQKKKWADALRHWQKANYQFTYSQDEVLLSYYYTLDPSRSQLKLIRPEEIELQAKLSGLNADTLMELLLSFPFKDLPKEVYESFGLLLFSGPLDKLSAEYAQKCLLCLSNFHSVNIAKCEPKQFIPKGRWLLNQIKIYCSYHPQTHTQLETYFKKALGLDPKIEEILCPKIGAFCFKAFVNVLYGIKAKATPEQEINTAIQEMLRSIDQNESVTGFLMLCNSEHFENTLFTQLFKELPKMLANEELTGQRSQIFKAFCEYLTKSPIELISSLCLEKLIPTLESDGDNNFVLSAFCEVFAAAEPTLCFEVVFETCKRIQGHSPSTPFTLIGSYAKRSPSNALKILVDQANRDIIPLSIIQENWNSLLDNADKSHLDDLTTIGLRLILKTAIDKSKLSADLFRLIGICCDFKEFTKAISLYEAGKNKKFFDLLSHDDCREGLKLCRHYYSLNKTSEAQALSLKLLASSDFLEFLLEHHKEHNDSKLVELMLKGLKNPLAPTLELNLVQVIFNHISERQNKNALSETLKQLLGQNTIKMVKVLKSDANLCSLLKLILNLKFDLHLIIDELDLWPFLQNQLQSSSNEYESLFPLFISTPDKHLKEGQSAKGDVYNALAKIHVNDPTKLITCLERGLITAKSHVQLAATDFLLLDNSFKVLEKKSTLQKSKELLEYIEKKWLKIDTELPNVYNDWLTNRWQCLALASINELPPLAAVIFLNKGPFANLQNQAAQLGLKLLTLKIPSTHSQVLEIGLLYNITDALFWKEALPLYSAKPTTGILLLEKLCAQDKPFIGPEADCQACWLLLLTLIKDHNKSLLMLLVRKYNLLIEQFNECPNQVKAILAYSFLDGLIDLLLDREVSKVEKQEILTKASALYDTWALLLPTDDIVKITIRFSSFNLTMTTKDNFGITVKALDKTQLNISPKTEKQFNNLICKTIETMIALDISDIPIIGQLEMVIEAAAAKLDPSAMIRFYAHQFNKEGYDLDHKRKQYAKIHKILFPKSNWVCRGFDPDQKKGVASTLEILLPWIVDNVFDQFRPLLMSFEKAKILSSERLAHWHAFDLLDRLEDANFRNITAPPLEKMCLTYTVLSEYSKELEKIKNGGDLSLECTAIAAELLFSMQSDTNLNALQKEAPKAPFLMQCFSLLNEILCSLINIEHDPSFNKGWLSALHLVSENWKFINGKLEYFLKTEILIIDPKMNDPLKLFNTLDPHQMFNTIDTVFTKLLEEIKTGSEKAVKKPTTENRSMVGYHLRAFIYNMIDSMLDYKPTDIFQQCSITAHVFFYLDLLGTLFVPDEILGKAILKMILGEVYPDNLICVIQTYLGENLFLNRCLYSTTFKKNNQELVCEYAMWDRAENLTPRKYQRDIDKQVELILKIFSSISEYSTGSKMQYAIKHVLQSQQMILCLRPDILRKLYFDLFKLVAKNPFWLQVLRIEDNSKMNAQTTWEYFGKVISKISDTDKQVTALRKQGIDSTPDFEKLNLIRNEFIRYYVKLSLRINDEKDGVQLNFNELMNVLQFLYYDSKSSAVNLSLVASIMPTAASIKEYHAQFSLLLNNLFKNSNKLFLPFLDLWISYLKLFNQTEEMIKFSNSELYKGISLSKGVLYANGSSCSDESIEDLKSFYLNYFDLIIESYSHDTKKGYSILLRELKDFFQQPFRKDAVVAKAIATTEVLLFQKLMPLAVKEGDEARKEFYFLFEQLITRYHEIDEIGENIFTAMRTWVICLQKADYIDEVDAIFCSTYLRYLFKNSLVMLTLYRNLLRDIQSMI